MAALLHIDAAGGLFMELVAIVGIVGLSIGFGLAGAGGALWSVLYLMTHPTHRLRHSPYPAFVMDPPPMADRSVRQQQDPAPVRASAA